jgi:hypothetical protein
LTQNSFNFSSIVSNFTKWKSKQKKSTIKNLLLSDSICASLAKIMRLFWCFFVAGDWRNNLIMRLQPCFFSYADPNGKFLFSDQYNFCSDELLRVKSTNINFEWSFVIVSKVSTPTMLSFDFRLQNFPLGSAYEKKYSCNMFCIFWFQTCCSKKDVWNWLYSSKSPTVNKFIFLKFLLTK